MKLTRIPILLTGAGSELAFGIIKASRLSRLPLEVVGCDADPEALGLRWVEHAEIVPRADREPERFVRHVFDLVRQYGIRAIVVTPDAELDLLPAYREELLDRFSCHLLVSSKPEMDRFHDKWSAFEWYRDHDLPTPETVLGEDAVGIDSLIEEHGFPLIVKPRQGGGSRSLFCATNRVELDKYIAVVDRPIVQPLVGDDDNEFTAGTFRTRDDRILTIVMQRQLKFGMTYKARTVQDSRLHHACAEIMQKTNLEGVNNIQFRTVGEALRILEINPRFSGTSGIRAHFGFNELDLAIRHFVLGEEVDQPHVLDGGVSRYMHESYSPSISHTWSSYATKDHYEEAPIYACQR